MNKILVAHPERGRFSVNHIDGAIPLDLLQEIVDGYIEVAHLPELDQKGIVMIANEEGLLYGLDVNQNLIPFFYVGNIAFVAEDGEELVGLNNGQLLFLKTWLGGLTR